jgi:hypothetical protein
MKIGKAGEVELRRKEGGSHGEERRGRKEMGGGFACQPPRMPCTDRLAPSPTLVNRSMELHGQPHLSSGLMTKQ